VGGSLKGDRVNPHLVVFVQLPDFFQDGVVVGEVAVGEEIDRVRFLPECGLDPRNRVGGSGGGDAIQKNIGSYFIAGGRGEQIPADHVAFVVLEENHIERLFPAHAVNRLFQLILESRHLVDHRPAGVHNERDARAEIDIVEDGALFSFHIPTHHRSGGWRDRPIIGVGQSRSPSHNKAKNDGGGKWFEHGGSF